MQVLPIKRRSSCDIRARYLRCIVCSHDDTVLVHPELLVPVRSCGSWAKLCVRELRTLLRQQARVVRTAVVRLGAESFVHGRLGRTPLCNDHTAVACTSVLSVGLFSADSWRAVGIESSSSQRHIRG